MKYKIHNTANKMSFPRRDIPIYQNRNSLAVVLQFQHPLYTLIVGPTQIVKMITLVRIRCGHSYIPKSLFDAYPKRYVCNVRRFCASESIGSTVGSFILWKWSFPLWNGLSCFWMAFNLHWRSFWCACKAANRLWGFHSITLKFVIELRTEKWIRNSLYALVWLK